MTNSFDDKVKFFCKEMCEELGLDSRDSYPGWMSYWEEFKPMVRDWLINEAFSKVRGRYWDDEKYQEARVKKQLVKT
ncbi:MAG TPA: hypothetical protein VEP90_00075 [Methylomirabilota bacterium]|nr:hypothetical protein [Methylomirabilota bacterium]